MNEDDDGIYEFAPLPPIDFQRKSEENYPSYWRPTFVEDCALLQPDL